MVYDKYMTVHLIVLNDLLILTDLVLIKVPQIGLKHVIAPQELVLPVKYSRLLDGDLLLRLHRTVAQRSQVHLKRVRQSCQLLTEMRLDCVPGVNEMCPNKAIITAILS